VLPVPTAIGGNFSDLLGNILLMSKTTRLLMLKEEKMLKDKLFGFGENTMVSTRDGNLCILTKKMLLEQKE
jgi:hypothetical protein